VTIFKRLKPRYFYGWNIVGASFLARLSYAEYHSSILGFFFNPLGSEFGWSRSSIAAVQTIARVTEAVIAPVIGPLIDKYGARVLMPVGAIIVGLTMLGVTQVSALWQFYLFRGVVVAIGFTLMGALVTNVSINNWFARRRVRSLGFLVAFGFGAAGPVAMNAVFDITGSYRPAFMIIIGLFAAAAFLIGVARPPSPHRYTTADGMTVSSAE